MPTTKTPSRKPYKFKFTDFWAIPVDTTVRVNGRKHRGVAYHFTADIWQSNAEYVMNCLGFENDQYFLSGDPKYLKLKVLAVKFRGKQENRHWYVQEAK